MASLTDLNYAGAARTGSIDDFMKQNSMLDASGQPQRPAFQGWTDPSTGKLLDQYGIASYAPVSEDRVGFNQAQLDSTGANAVTNRALQQGPSDWAQLMRAKMGSDQQTALDTSDQNAASGIAQAQNQLASQGGLSGAAAERIATQGGKAQAFNRNALLRQGLTNDQSLGIQDQGQKDQFLSQLPGVDLAKGNFQLQNNLDTSNIGLQNNAQQAQISFQNQNEDMDRQKYNIDNAMRGMTAQNQNNQNTYNQGMQAWAAGKQADAMANAHDNSWLCTEASKLSPFTDADKKALAKLTRFAMKKDKAAARFYLTEGQSLVERMKCAHADWSKNQVFVGAVLYLLHQGELERAWELYVKHTLALIEHYWPECRHPVVMGFRAQKGA